MSTLAGAPMPHATVHRGFIRVTSDANNVVLIKLAAITAVRTFTDDVLDRQRPTFIYAEGQAFQIRETAESVLVALWEGVDHAK